MTRNKLREEPEVITTWCRLQLPLDSETKGGDRLNGMNDSVHDECWRRLETTPQNGGGLWVHDLQRDAWHLVR